MSDPNAWKILATKEQIAEHEKQEAETRKMFREMFPVLKSDVTEDSLVAGLSKPFNRKY